jgi:hypothetical protein
LIVLVTLATLVFYWIGDIAEGASPVDLEVRNNYKDTILSTLAAKNHTSVLSWDYGMTDGKNHDKYLLHYGYCAALGPSFPVLVCVQGCEGKESPRQQRLKELEDQGMAVFVALVNKALPDAIPDTLGMSSEEIGQLPEDVQNFKCYAHIKSGEPFLCSRKIQQLRVSQPQAKEKLALWILSSFQQKVITYGY